MQKYIFTFGSGHNDPNHSSLINFYTVIEAPTYSAAREKMWEKRGPKWSFEYETEEEAGVERWNLTLIPFEELGAQQETQLN